MPSLVFARSRPRSGTDVCHGPQPHLRRGLTAFEGDASAATVTHILNHTSGLPVHYSVFYQDEPDRQPPAVSESIRRYGILVHPPGAVYHYANFGFGLVSHIISKVSGVPHADFMKTEVFLPLEMTHTSIDVGPGLGAYAAVRYDGDGEPLPFYISDHPGASQVYSSAHDLIRFGLFHLGHTLPEQSQIISQESIGLMKRESDPNPELMGEWLGRITTYDDTVGVTLTIQADGDVHVDIDGQLGTLMDRVRFADGFLSGTSYGTILSGDAVAHPHNISYRMLLDGDVLSGFVTTGFTTDRSYGNWSSYIRLVRGGSESAR
jgi:CubicO group peptidase (beta-lactamase class C family)